MDFRKKAPMGAPACPSEQAKSTNTINSGNKKTPTAIRKYLQSVKKRMGIDNEKSTI